MGPAKRGKTGLFQRSGRGLPGQRGALAWRSALLGWTLAHGVEGGGPRVGGV
jgi:hypothetical protein